MKLLLSKLLKFLREDFDADHRRPTVTVSRGDYERLLKFAEKFANVAVKPKKRKK